MSRVIAAKFVPRAEQAAPILFVCNKSKLFQKGFQFLSFSPKSSETSISQVRKKLTSGIAFSGENSSVISQRIPRPTA